LEDGLKLGAGDKLGKIGTIKGQKTCKNEQKFAKSEQKFAKMRAF